METAFDSEQQQISDLMLDSWVSLASTGDPNPGGGATNISVVWNPGQTMVCCAATHGRVTTCCRYSVCGAR